MHGHQRVRPEAHVLGVRANEPRREPDRRDRSGRDPRRRTRQPAPPRRESRRDGDDADSHEERQEHGETEANDIAAQALEIPTAAQGEIGVAEHEAGRDPGRGGSGAPGYGAPVVRLGDGPRHGEEERKADDQEQRVDACRGEHAEEQARDERRARAAQRAAVGEEPQRCEQQELAGDLGDRVTRERHLRRNERERDDCRERGGRTPKEPARRDEQRQERDARQQRGGREHEPIAAEVAHLGQHGWQQMRELEAEHVIAVLVHADGAVGQHVLACERSRVRDDAQRAVVRDPTGGVGVHPAVAVDHDVLGGVERVPGSDRGHERQRARGGQMIGPAACARRPEDRTRDREERDPRNGTDREHDVRVVHTGDRARETDRAERRHRGRGHEGDAANPSGFDTRPGGLAFLAHRP